MSQHPQTHLIGSKGPKHKSNRNSTIRASIIEQLVSINPPRWCAFIAEQKLRLVLHGQDLRGQNGPKTLFAVAPEPRNAVCGTNFSTNRGRKTPSNAAKSAAIRHREGVQREIADRRQGLFFRRVDTPFVGSQMGLFWLLALKVTSSALKLTSVHRVTWFTFKNVHAV